ncbi:hypothetical protein INT43_008970 [Umbelopsis isabellina]|uniref:3-oxoacyl-[acyl-carrier-protein] reductase n=1 Tax=Mortierella isabellina TaxID=91625 RepID=A0A8H7UH05_MORIS|nr:hypothetical protein INT43_008970 [Umbelopsis isabellina]
MSSFEYSLAGRISVVTGGASGIGEACVRKLFALGSTVIIADLSQEKGDTIVHELTSNADVSNEADVVYMNVDLSKWHETKEFAKTVLEKFGCVHILINNAGCQIIASLEEFSLDNFRYMNELMLVSPLLLTQAFIPTMYKAKWGRIINIGSIHSLVASPGKIAYISIKHALLGLTKGTAVEAGKHGVTANCICPFHVRTLLVEKQLKEQANFYGMSEEEVGKKILLRDAAIKRFLEPSEIAELCAFLCSNAASGITGSEQKIDCGWTAQ